MNTVKSYASLNASSQLAPFSFDQRELTENDVLIDILYCGVCHSDVHQARNEWGGSMFPMVPGHEIIGKVTQVGSNVKNHNVGDVVGIGCMVSSCKTCHTCQDNEEQFCGDLLWTYNSFEKKAGRQTFGGYATEIIANQDFVLKIGANLKKDLARTAPLLCAGITTYSPLKQWGIKKGDKVAIMGLGGLGHMAIKFAHSFGCEVTVLSTSKNKEEDAMKLGADHFVVTSNKDDIMQLNNKFDFILNTVSANIEYATYLQLLKPRGKMILVGIQPQPSVVPAGALVMGKRVLAGSLIGGIKETQEMLDYCDKHNIFSDIEVIKMEEINEAYERMMKADVKYRFVIDIQNSSF